VIDDVMIARDTSTAGVVVLTLNNPDRRNVLSAAMVEGLHNALDEVEGAGDANCVVITGAGAAFCAGAELSTLERAANGDFGPVNTVYDGFLRVLRSPLPTIAAVNGAAVGAGFNLALACDVRLASHRARFDARFGALRILPGGGHTWLLTRAVGPQSALLASLFAQVWDAPTALSHGLVASVHEPDDLLPAAIALGRQIAKHDPAYVRQFKQLLRTAGAGSSYEEVLAAETQAQAWSLQQPAFLEGLAEIQAQIARTTK
jgi:enoyl-CoA hydratase